MCRCGVPSLAVAVLLAEKIEQERRIEEYYTRDKIPGIDSPGEFHVGLNGV